MAGKAIDMSGETYGRLTVLSRVASDKHRAAKWLCRCECGSTVEVVGQRLRGGRTKSCGCLHDERQVEWGRELGLRRKRHGASARGSTMKKEYRAYGSAKRRCENPNYIGFERYGGRGIEFRFSSFEEWLDELGLAPGPEYSVDRINVDGHYEPGNVRWATSDVQYQNRHHCSTCTCWVPD